MAHASTTGTHVNQNAHGEHFDAHGHKDHGHVIISLWTLRLVLATLLFFTVATVGASVTEAFVAKTFSIVIPQAVNAFVALSIAVVKTVLVVLIFMQLKYDNPLNGMIFIFTLMTVACFMGFTLLDLGTRGTVDRFKAQYITAGGMGLKNDKDPITEQARRAGQVNAASGHGHDDHAAPGHAGPAPERQIITNAGYLPEVPAAGSSANFSRPVRGLTLPGLRAPAHAEPAPAGDHDAAPAAH